MTEKTEKELFEEHIKDKSQASINTYRRGYKKLTDATSTSIHQTTQKTLLNHIRKLENMNSRQLLINVGIIVRRLYDDVKVDLLMKEREENKLEIEKDVKIRNKKKVEELPSLEEFERFVDYLYESKDWVSYIINYLILNFNTRNQDLIFTITNLQRDTKNKNENYMWIGRDKVTYIRNIYKTAYKHGTKRNVITDSKFRNAMMELRKMRRKGKGLFAPEGIASEHLGYYIIQKTFNKLGEGNLLKVVINGNSGNFQKLREISANRGTGLSVLLENYDITNQ